MRQLIKMKRKIYTKIERSLYAFVMLLLSMLSQDHHTRGSRQVNGNILNSSASSSNLNAVNGSLPGLTERVNVNSRHLSASSLASSAAAQVAASNGVSATNSQDPNRAYLTHQQHFQQQQQLTSSSNSQQQQQVNQAAAPVAGSSAPQQPVPQFNSAQPQQVGVSAATATAAAPTPVGGVTPVMSTTFTFNPQTGQYQATDLATGLTAGLVPGPTAAASQQQPASFANNQQQNFGPFGSGGSSISNYGIPQQQQQYNSFRPPQVAFNQQQDGSRYQTFAAGGNNGQFNLVQANNLPNNLNQFVSQQRQVSQFSRRNGLAGGGSRFNTNLFGLPPNLATDEDSGFYQQPQQQQQQLGDLNQYGGIFDSSIYGNYLPYSTGNNNNNNHQGFTQADHSYGGLIAPQPTSLTPVVQLPSSPPPSASSSLANGGGASFSAPESRQEPQCVAADNRHGTCYQASECIRRGGTPMGKCNGAPGSSSELTGTSYVCCLFDVSCGQFAAERFVYFRNPGYPLGYEQSRMCRAKIGKLDKGICQFRLDLLRFDVAKPTNGNCSQDMFVVSGQNENYIIPKICGLNDGQHYYVGVDESGVITLHMMMMGQGYRRSFEIMITQIPCRSDYAAPAHCLQYFMGTHGTIKSFNYDDEQQYLSTSTGPGGIYDLLPQASADGAFGSGGQFPPPYGLQFNNNQRRQSHLIGAAALNGGQRLSANIYQQQQPGELFGGYPNDLDYTMCIRKESGFCSITYQLSRSDQGLQPFAVGGGGGYQQFSNESGQFGANNWQLPVSTECRDDYLLIGGVRLCSGGGGYHPSNGGFDGSFNSAGSPTIQFAQNGTILSSAGINAAGSQQQQLQQLQNQQNLLLQQLARLQQQQLASTTSNVSYANPNGASGNNQAAASNHAAQQQQQIGNQNQLDQQQATLMQQLLLVQQQLSFLTNSNVGQQQQQQQQQQYRPAGTQLAADLQGAIITDTTSGPFLLRFVSNLARNARGFHIDYRQNPCK